MVDFNKLRDPAWQEKMRAEEKARQLELEQKEAELRAAIDLCREYYEELPANERSLVSSCQHKLNSFGLVSEKQSKWLFDIEKRLRSKNSSVEAKSRSPGMGC